MSSAEAIARIYETYTEQQLRDAKDEPDTGVIQRYSGHQALVVLFGDDPQGTNATRRRVRRAFEKAGHARAPAQALANARRIFKRDEN